MNHLKTFNEALRYSGGDVKNMPVIGKIITKPIGPYEGTEYNVVEIIEDKGVKYYICDFWYKEGRVPQIVSEHMVEKYIEI